MKKVRILWKTKQKLKRRKKDVLALDAFVDQHCFSHKKVKLIQTNELKKPHKNGHEMCLGNLASNYLKCSCFVDMKGKEEEKKKIFLLTSRNHIALPSKQETNRNRLMLPVVVAKA